MYVNESVPAEVIQIRLIILAFERERETKAAAQMNCSTLADLVFHPSTERNTAVMRLRLRQSAESYQGSTEPRTLPVTSREDFKRKTGRI